MRLSITVLCATFLFSAVSLQSDEGRIPLYQPTTITNPGHYILTRDIDVPGGSALQIQASRVTIDLNSHTISGPGGISGSGDLIALSGSATDVVIRNGHIEGGARGVVSQSTMSRTRLRVEQVHLRNSNGPAIEIDNAESVDIVSCIVSDVFNTFPGVPAISISTFGGTFSGRIIGNRVERTRFWAISLTGLQAGEVMGNSVSDTSLGSSDYSGLIVYGNGNSLVDNMVRTGNGIGISVVGNDNMVRHNTSTGNNNNGLGIFGDRNHVSDNVVNNNGDPVDGPEGMLVFGSRNQIRWNHVSGNRGDGVHVGGSENLLEGNVIQGNNGGPHACGIRFDADAGHAYRQNMLRGNPEGAICGPANTDAGGNIL